MFQFAICVFVCLVAWLFIDTQILMLTQEALYPLSYNPCPSVHDISDVKCMWHFNTNNQLANSQAPAANAMIHFHSTTQNLH